MKRWLSVVGIGEDGLAGLAPAARTLVDTAEILVGGARHLAMVPENVAESVAERFVWDRPLERTIAAIAARRGKRVTVLASGDPLWHGVGATLLRRFPREEMTVLPQPSAFSLAAARLGWPLAECAAISLHARPLDGLHLHLAPNRRILALAEDSDTPRRVARMLTESGWGASRLVVLGYMGGPRAAAVAAPAREWGER
ncbi:MAG: precorrin-6y C5,15-methyltransferase (decarboxylating) subunit CbiE, partial [Stellaceae bacterium]